MKLSGLELKHIHQLLSLDINNCTNLLETEISNRRVENIASRMEDNRKMLERIDQEQYARPEFRI